MTSNIKGSGGGQFATDGNIYVKSDGYNGWITSFLNDLKTSLINGRLYFRWISDTSDNVSKLYIYVDNVLVAKIPQGTGL